MGTVRRENSKAGTPGCGSLLILLGICLFYGWYAWNMKKCRDAGGIWSTPFCYQEGERP